MLGRWTTDATDEEVLQYIDDCMPMVAHQSEATIKFSDLDEAMSLLSFVARSLRQQKAEFIREIQHDHSSSALTCTQTFKVLLKLQADLLSNIKEYGEGRWREGFMADLPSYPNNVR